MKKILFDMDGTLYSFENGQYRGSKLEQEVQNNAIKLLKNLETGQNPEEKFNKIKNDFGEEFSIAFEEIYGITKQKYFEIVWDINPEGIITDDREILPLFEYLKSKGFDIYVVSESPIIWIQRVLTFLKVNGIISGVFSGQGDERKSNGLLYDKVINEIGSGHFMVGDQLLPDVIMARQKGFLPIYLTNGDAVKEAKYLIRNLKEIYNLI